MSQKEQSPQAEGKKGLVTQSPERIQRIQAEYEALASSVEQRKIVLLDFIRRGRQKDGIDLQRDTIRGCTEVLKKSGEAQNPLHDLLFNVGIDQAAVERQVIQELQEMERIVAEEDRRCREQLSQIGVTCPSDIFVDQKRIQAIHEIVVKYHRALEPEEIQKSKAPDPQKAARMKCIQQLKSLIDLPPEQENAIVERLSSWSLSEPIAASERMSALGAAVLQEIRGPGKDKKDQVFHHIPVASEYTGEKVRPENIEFGQPKGNLCVLLKRTDVPKVLEERLGKNPIYGATVIDNNLGYNEMGEPRDVEGIIVIDHHDAQEKRYAGARYDTATVMISRIIKEKVDKATKLVRAESTGLSEQEIEKKAWKKAMELYLSDFGGTVIEPERGETAEKKREIKKLRLYVNHFDTDSVLSSWAFRNPRLAMKYKKTIEDISTCGDFLVGTEQNEFGAGARDYVYIIENYIDACEQKMKDDKGRQPIEALKQQMSEELERAIQENGLESQGIDRQNLDRSLKAIMQNQEKENEHIVALRREQIATTDKARQKTIAEQITALQKSDTKLNALQTIMKRQAEMAKQLAKLESAARQVKLSEEDNAKLLAHIHDTLEDVITHPFKYQYFLNKGRAVEQQMIESLDQDYRNGKKEIRRDEQDQGIIIIEPMAQPESVDGVYFYLRRRVDFNQPLVVFHDKDLLSFAINTQNRKDLEKYDFNLLADRIRAREKELISQQITSLFEPKNVDISDILQSGRTDDASQERKTVDVKLREAATAAGFEASALKELEAKSKMLMTIIQGLDWRSRTQYVKRHHPYALSFDEAMDILRAWKRACESVEKKDRKKEKV